MFNSFSTFDIDAIPASFKATRDKYNSTYLYVNCTSNEVLALKAGLLCNNPLYELDIMLLDNCKFMLVAHEKWTPENDVLHR